jgi:hypothetical protein
VQLEIDAVEVYLDVFDFLALRKNLEKWPTGRELSVWPSWSFSERARSAWVGVLAQKV